jgi:hypothetical protein
MVNSRSVEDGRFFSLPVHPTSVLEIYLGKWDYVTYKDHSSKIVSLIVKWNNVAYRGLQLQSPEIACIADHTATIELQVSRMPSYP